MWVRVGMTVHEVKRNVNKKKINTFDTWAMLTSLVREEMSVRKCSRSKAMSVELSLTNLMMAPVFAATICTYMYYRCMYMYMY